MEPDFVSVAVSDSEFLPLVADATRREKFAVSWRATTTSCARICPVMAKPQISAVKSRFSIKRHRDKKIRRDWQGLNAKLALCHGWRFELEAEPRMLSVEHLGNHR
ncbi:MAG: hypothetical protein DME50_18885 [Verrucomicrobia bacterium]|nr:MAG: hypothetical protein DME50_18885 [Verrucomicrobiota bacterium]